VLANLLHVSKIQISKPFVPYPTTFKKCIQSRLVIYLIDSNLGVGLHFVCVHIICCECEFISGAEMCHLIHREKVEKKFGNMQHVLKDSIGEFNPSFASDFDRRVVPSE
jgi:hypothetical protein